MEVLERQHTVHTTRDYDQFKFFEFNRPINEGLVKRIMKSIETIGYVEGKEILVTRDMAILDGQHRFTACVRLGIEVQYTITDKDPHDTVVNLNAHQEHWLTKNYIHAWSESGIECYKDLQEFQQKYGFSTATAIEIFFTHGKNKSMTKDIKEGYVFKVNPKAQEIAQFITSCNMVPYNQSKNFVRAAAKLVKLTNKDQQEKVLKYLPSLQVQPSMGHYLTAFENIVNRGVQAKNRVSFNIQ